MDIALMSDNCVLTGRAEDAAANGACFGRVTDFFSLLK
jgi:hypothetical protein